MITQFKIFEKIYHSNNNDLNNFKFKIDDIVKISNANKDYFKKNYTYINIDKLFKIVAINNDPHTLLKYNIESLEDDSKYIWVHDDFIVRATDEEIKLYKLQQDSNKYNI